MGYTALKRMREINKQRYGIDGPRIPEMGYGEEISGELEKNALLFLREDCTNLHFALDEAHMNLTDTDGTSVAPNQIPLNMEKDLDRLCFENAIHRFMKTGMAVEAFDIYYAYLDMFVGSYCDSKRMIEMLSEFESNTSSILMKHRDHYSHSVYVFVIGLAIYHSNEAFRATYEKYYKLSREEAAKHYLKYWGLSALFHDIGYPFELPFEQVKSYFGKDASNVPFVAYSGTGAYIRLGSDAKKYMGFLKELPLDSADLTIAGIIAANLAEKLADRYSDFDNYRKLLADGKVKDYKDYLENEVLGRKPSEPDHFGGFMDHAFFSATILLKQLAEVLPENEINPDYVDAITAIVLHNSMYKFSITNVKGGEYNRTHHFTKELHPLAYMLMLCDELQCWDRTSYGQNSRQEFHPMWCDFSFDAKTIKATYCYDEEFSSEKRTSGTFKKMLAKDDKKCSFLTDIEDIVAINDDDADVQLSIATKLCRNNRTRYSYLSTSSFLHLYNFALAISAQYSARHYDTKEWIDLSEKEMSDAFEMSSLEYKLSNIAQAKSFSRHLDKLGYFYTDRCVDYPMVHEFTLEDLHKLGILEHDRWEQEKYSMGWLPGTKAQEFPDKKTQKLVREQTRMHWDLGTAFDELSQEEKDKDTDPMNDMIKLLENYDGVRIYKL